MRTTILAVSAGLAMTSFAAADVVNHLNVSSPNYDFTSISESSSTDMIGPMGYFRQPTTAADSLVFNPQGFVATTPTNFSGGGDITDVQLNFNIMRRANAVISSFVFRESGDYNLVGINPSTYVRVTCGINITVTETTTGPINAMLLQGTLVFTPIPNVGTSILPNGVEYHATQDASAANWLGVGNFDLSAFLVANGVSGQATKVSIALDNTLIAVSPAGGVAFIAKKTTAGVVIDVIPAPSGLAVLGLGGVLSVRRRRRA